MIAESGQILRSEDVIPSGQYQLDVGQTQIHLDELQQKKAVSVPAKVSILESNQESVLLKVLCACGEKIYVRCEFGIGDDLWSNEINSE